MAQCDSLITWLIKDTLERAVDMRKVQSPESRVQSPESRVQSPKSKVQSPKSGVAAPFLFPGLVGVCGEGNQPHGLTVSAESINLASLTDYPIYPLLVPSHRRSAVPILYLILFSDRTG